MNTTKTTLLTAVAGLAALMMTGGAFAKTFEAIYTVSIHSRATAASKVVDKLFEGERVKITTCDDKWCFITHDGPDGWVTVASLESLGGYSDGGPTIVFEGGFDFPHPPKPPIVVDPGPKKPPFRPIIGQLPVSVLQPITNPGGGGTGGNSGGNTGNGGGTLCFIGKPCHLQP